MRIARRLIVALALAATTSAQGKPQQLALCSNGGVVKAVETVRCVAKGTGSTIAANSGGHKSCKCYYKYELEPNPVCTNGTVPADPQPSCPPPSYGFEAFGNCAKICFEAMKQASKYSGHAQDIECCSVPKPQTPIETQ